MPELYGSLSLAMTSYSTKICAECGKTFECPRETRYRIGDDVFCSYGCFRPSDKKRREAARKNAELLYAYKPPEPKKPEEKSAYMLRKESAPIDDQIEQVEKRLAVCAQKAKEYRTKYEHATERRRRAKAHESWKRWVLNKASAEDALRILKKRKERERESPCGV